MTEAPENIRGAPGAGRAADQKARLAWLHHHRSAGASIRALSKALGLGERAVRKMCRVHSVPAGVAEGDGPRIVLVKDRYFIRGVPNPPRYGFGCRANAETILDRILRAEQTRSLRKMRKCLGGCDQLFLSEGPGNRICEKCKASERFRGVV